ncbi:ABC transporter ATP-binding protein [Martelella lutilitoris]|uniref:ABC transporter ATP-binding protein n=1 Tax=Martelella lutilitoris TaxID=2583532 RepID=A0A5C4JUT1_9HYPH|nr:ABC transporter ATP-binding protein [Martelella lutilitoris]TNB49146.1 ABC transporter ATP-binding protein [Martelella lutilitoris]
MTPLLRTENLCRRYGADGPAALDKVSISLQAGEILGIVGESGSGKSTLARLVMALDRPTSGAVFLENRQITALSDRKLRPLRRNFQMVFQDPYGSLDPRHTIGRIIGEPLGLEENAPRGAKRRERIGALLEEVGLSASDIDRYPHQFSGGQRQRIAIARALITRPKLLVADEPTSALDVTVQAQILALLLRMRADHGVSILLITHDIGVVDEICDRVAVMRAGRVVETGPLRDVLDNPHEAYTRRLLAAEPTLARLGRST